MHTVTELETSVPAFLGKLWKLVEDPETDDLICWSPNGRSFFIRNQAQFARELLPHYYKHNNMASFVRQLNMYGFHKKVSVDLGGLKCDRDEMEFAHQYFVKGHPYLLEHIKRKIASSKSQDSHQPMKPEVMNKVLSEVRTMRGRQEHLDSRLGAMKRENEALWRELAMLRRKHLKQQEIVNKLIHFLVTLVQPSRSGGLPVKRRYPLMIDNTNHPRSKQSKMAKPEASPTGPVIHELDASEHDSDSQYTVGDMFENSNPAIQSPEQQDMSSMDDENLEVAELMESAIHIPEDIQTISSQQLAAMKKPKGKKKRKNKVPVKILIPATENGEEAREETLMLEVSPEEVPTRPTNAQRDGNVKRMKAVPVKTVRSSKLAAMAANINKMNEMENDEDVESSEDVDDVEARENDAASLIKLEEILTMPDDLIASTDDSADNANAGEEQTNDNDDTSWMDLNGTMNYKKIIDQVTDNRSNNGNGSASGGGVGAASNSAGQTETDPLATGSKGSGAATSSSSKSKDLSLSCVNPSGKSDATYREEMDNHLETMQTELENLREVLRNEGYSIDANTLLGLFGADDPMSFGIPVNPELDPHSQRERDEEERSTDYSGYTAAGGELMAYNPSSNLLDFDDDIFLGAGGDASPSVTAGATDPSGYYNSDPQDIEDSKASLLASLEAATDKHTTTS